MSKLGGWAPDACELCRQGMISGGWPPPRRVGVSADPIFLHFCDHCGAFWEENLRERHTITEGQARRDFPDAFPVPGPPPKDSEDPEGPDRTHTVPRHD